MPKGDADSRKAKANAKYLLVGRRVASFCAEYVLGSSFGRSGQLMPNVLVVKYVVNAESARGRQVRHDFKRVRKQRLVPQFDVMASDADRASLVAAAEGRPPWRELLEAVKVISPPTAGESKYAQALDWLLDYQSEELQARRYPYVAETDPDTGETILRQDDGRDRAWRFSSAMAQVFAESSAMRPLMGEFFSGVATAEGEMTVHIYQDVEGRKDRATQRSWSSAKPRTTR